MTGSVMTVLDEPRLDIGGPPHLAHGQYGGRFGEVGMCDELLYALPGDAEQRAYLCCSHDVQGPHHASQGTRRLTRPQAWVHNSHMTRAAKTVTVTLQIKVDAAAWTEEFGTDDVKEDAARYFESAVWGSPAADVMAVKSVESR